MGSAQNEGVAVTHTCAYARTLPHTVLLVVDKVGGALEDEVIVCLLYTSDAADD